MDVQIQRGRGLMCSYHTVSEKESQRVKNVLKVKLSLKCNTGLLEAHVYESDLRVTG